MLVSKLTLIPKDDQIDHESYLSLANQVRYIYGPADPACQFRQMASVTWSDPKHSTLCAIGGSLLWYESLLAVCSGFPFPSNNPQLLYDLISMLVHKRTYN